MKQQVSPVVIVLIVIGAVVGLGFFFNRAMQPAPYIPSPGAGGRPNTGVPAYAQNPAAAEGKSTPVVPPAGSMAGNPGSLKH
jgi:hypothetical protein